MIPRRRIELVLLVIILAIAMGSSGCLFFWAYESSGIFSLPPLAFASAVYGTFFPIIPIRLVGWILGDLGGILNFYPLFYFIVFPDVIQSSNLKEKCKNAVKSLHFWKRMFMVTLKNAIYIYIAIGYVPIVDQEDGKLTGFSVPMCNKKDPDCSFSPSQ